MTTRPAAGAAGGEVGAGSLYAEASQCVLEGSGRPKGVGVAVPVTKGRKRLPASIQAAIDAAEAEDTQPRADRMALTLPFPPSVNTLYATAMKPGRGLRRVKSERGRGYDETVRGAVRLWVFACQQRPPAPPFRLMIEAYPPLDGQRHDLTNLFKAPEDALMKAIGEDDDDVLEVHAFKRDRDRQPRIEVTLEHVEPAGPGGSAR